MEFLPVLIIASSALGIIAFFYWQRYKKTNVELKSKNRDLERHLFDEEIINEFSNKFTSLDIKRVSETLLDATSKLIPFSVISYALIEGSSINISNRKKENVGEPYLNGVQRILLTALITIDPTLKSFPVSNNIVKNDLLMDSNTYFDATPVSYFNIPLVVNNKLVGMIHISSKGSKTYEEKDMMVLFKIVNRATQAIGNLENIIATEKGKTDSLVYSLSSGAILFMFDRGEMRVEMINAAAKEFLKVDEENSVASIVNSLGQTLAVTDKIKEVVKDKKSLMFKNISIHGRHFKLAISPVFFYETERIIGVSITMQDITLEKEIDAMRESYTNVIVHELKAPLAAIHGAVGLITSPKVSADDKKKMLSVIEDSTVSMLSEVDDLLDASKMNAGAFTVHKKMGDIHDVIKHEIEKLIAAASEKRISVTSHFEMTIPQFEFDPFRMSQAVGNLISNSIKFTPTGGSINVKTQAKNGIFELEVSDNGIGIDESEKSKLFGKYSQFGHLHGVSGTGLGLYIVKGIIDAHNGHIEVSTEKGKGTRVVITIPLGFERKHIEDTKREVIVN